MDFKVCSLKMASQNRTFDKKLYIFKLSINYFLNRFQSNSPIRFKKYMYIRNFTSNFLVKFKKYFEFSVV